MFAETGLFQADVRAEGFAEHHSSSSSGSSSSSSSGNSSQIPEEGLEVEELPYDAPSDIWDNSVPWVTVKELHPTGVVSTVNDGRVIWSNVSYLNIDVMICLPLLALPAVVLSSVVLLTCLVSFALETNSYEESPEDLGFSRTQGKQSSKVFLSLEESAARLTPRSQRLYAWWALLCRCIPCAVVFGLPVSIAAYSWPYPFEVFAVLRLLSAVYVLQYGIYMSTFGTATYIRMKHSMAANYTPTKAGSQQEVLHWVIIPQYDEDVEVIAMTLESIAQGRSAGSFVGVVLAMEERDPKASQKTALLKERFAKRFSAIVDTYHPPNLPNDPPGKASNLAWAFAELEQHVAREGQDVSRIVLTVADADTEFHESYFDMLASLFSQCDEEERALRIWQSGVLHLKNYHRQPCIVTTGSVFIAMNELAGLSDPNAMRVPYSTYSISMQLVQRVGGWDPCWIAEDWHMGLKCFIATDGRCSVHPIMLPTLNYTPEENSWLGTVMARWTQAKRHALGFSDLSYYFMMMPLRFSSALSNSKGAQRAAALRDLFYMSGAGCGMLVKFVNTHVMLGISWVYLVFAMLLQLLATVHMEPHRMSEVLFSSANLCFVTMGFAGLLFTIVFMAMFIQVYGLTKERIEPAAGWGAGIFSSNVLHFLYLAIMMQICSPVFFIGVALATWRAAVLTMFTQTFDYETAAKPTSQTRKSSEGAALG